MSERVDLQALVERFRIISQKLSQAGKRRPSRSKIRDLRSEVEDLIEMLREHVGKIDPVRQPEHFLDPSDPKTLGRLIAETLLDQKRHQMSELAPFYGSGVYSLYYHGDFPAYQPISGTRHPIYIGKANPKRPEAQTPNQQGRRLWRRLNDHLRSLEKVQNLRLDDFDSRYLVVKSAWQATAEDYLIQRFRPVWNQETNICYGFGKHGDAPATRTNRRSPWDELHPGREWAWSEGNLPNPKTAEEIIEDIRVHFQRNPPEGGDPGGA